MQSNNNYSKNNANPWWKKDKHAEMNARVQQIHTMNDPGTFADEILRVSNFLLWLSLGFTAVLCFLSYNFFFARFVDPMLAVSISVAVTLLIEYGKRQLSLSMLRMPFMQGWNFIFSARENTLMFVGLSVFAVTVFSISVYNSTNGAAKYAQQIADKKTETVFSPDTKTIDDQIQNLQNQINNAPMVTWKGREYYQDKKSVRAAQASIGLLQEQRKTAIDQQRSDFERLRGQNDDANQHSSGLALRIGGWFELLQIITMLIIAACERVLFKRFKQQQAANLTSYPTNHNDSINSKPFGNQIGFKLYDNPSNPVSQSVPPVSQHQTTTVDENTTEPAYKHFSTNFKREVNNLISGNGDRNTVCARLNDALRGMIHHAPAITEKTRISEFTYLDNFAGKTHNDLLNQYTQDNIYRTPLGLYKDNMEVLYQILRTPVTA